MDFQKIFSLSLLMLYSSPLGLAASVVVLTTLNIALIYSLQQPAYICFAVATKPYILKISTFYHVLFYKATY